MAEGRGFALGRLRAGRPRVGRLPSRRRVDQYPPAFCERHRVVLLSRGEEAGAAPVAAAAAPVPGYLPERLRRIHREPVEIRPVPPHEISRLLARLRLEYRPDPPSPAMARASASAELAGDLSQAPGEIALQSLLEEAWDCRASDLHLAPRGTDFSVQFRVDGVLGAQQPLDGALALRVLARVKALIRGNPSQRRRPQEGRFTRVIRGERVEVRVSILPGLTGESSSLRLLPVSRSAADLSELGFSEAIAAALRRVAGRREGLFLVSGPTGSGKTTTLHAVARLSGTTGRRVVTIEDPVEYRLTEGVQLQINRALQLDFDALLAKALRHDPDVLLIGEIRDSETAGLAMRAALTGHLVLASMHTGSAFTAVLRLINLGCPREEVSAALCGVLSQRLVRRVGADGAPTGGRVPISAALLDPPDWPSTSEVQELPRFRRVEAADREWLYVRIEDDARRLVAAGTSSAKEVSRVLGTVAGDMRAGREA